MVVRRVPRDNWCVVCDNDMAEVEISHNGSLRVFWSNPNDREICLCRKCFNNLKMMINEIDLEDE